MATRRIIMAGNPNVGKSTLFNRLTGMKQHTGNWPGKTVGSAFGSFEYNGETIELADTPGTYSLFAHSPDEENARDAILFEEADCIIVVCDACCLERSLYLALQIQEVRKNIVVCVNLMDEATKKGIAFDFELLSKRMAVPVIGISAARDKDLDKLLGAVMTANSTLSPSCCSCGFPDMLEPLTDYFRLYQTPLPADWLAAQCVIGDKTMLRSLESHYGLDINDEEYKKAAEKVQSKLRQNGITRDDMADFSSVALKNKAEKICSGAIRANKKSAFGSRLDTIFSRKIYALPVMFALLLFILWLSISASNYPSQLLSDVLSSVGTILRRIMEEIKLPPILTNALVDGVYKTLSWVVAVMLPPMAVFFPLFTLLEDFGLLPRIAFSLDGYFRKCGSCGKQALTMCMGLGCNAVGVTGCRIIDSPREKKISMLTNSFVPCNGRFPTMITVSLLLFSGTNSQIRGIYSAITVAVLIILGVILTLLASKFLSITFFKGSPSSFILELPPFRKPKIGDVVVRSIFDRTLFVLMRAIKVAAPAGFIIWLLANADVNGTSILTHISIFLDNIAVPFGMDGAILLAFILGIPANEIVLPIILMCYLSTNSLTELETTSEMALIFRQNGWTSATSLCVLVFTLLHWPCATTLATIKKESGSLGYTILAALLPTAFGLILCFVINFLSKI